MTEQEVLEHCVSGARRCNIQGLRTRIFDNSFDVLSAPTKQKRLVVVGLNGSDADREFEAVASLQQAYKDRSQCNVTQGATLGWNGYFTLAERLLAIPAVFGFNVSNTIYTNAILMCSKSASTIKSQVRETHLESYEALKVASMQYFAEVTMPLTEAELIVAYSNSRSGISSARVLYDAFGEEGPVHHVSQHFYWATYSFRARIRGRHYPVVCIRHLSRFKPDPVLLRQAWDAVR